MIMTKKNLFDFSFLRIVKYKRKLAGMFTQPLTVQIAFHHPRLGQTVKTNTGILIGHITNNQKTP